LTPKLQALYREDPDPGVHSAVHWLLGERWGMAEVVRRLDAELSGQPTADRGWCVNKQGQTFAIVPGPVEFLMGSPVNEPNRHSSETLHRRRIPRSYALATKKVTGEQFERFLSDVQRKYPGVIRHPSMENPAGANLKTLASLGLGASTAGLM